MPIVKIPHHAAKKAAKKNAKKHSPEHDQERFLKDTRRSYEHLGRVEILSSLMPAEHLSQVRVLTHLAQGAFSGHRAQEAADLLRAAEHLCFAQSLERNETDGSVSKLLETTIKEEIKHLQGRASKRADHDKMPLTVQAVFAFMSKASASAMRAKKYRCALEMGRGAEALSHVTKDVFALPPDRQKKLPA